MKRKRPMNQPQRWSGALSGNNGVIATNVTWATTFRARRRGVIGMSELGPDDAFVIVPCRQVHTIGVAYPLDAVFCDRHLRVLHVDALEPGSIGTRVRSARMCIELRGGRAAACVIEPGVQLAFGGPS